MHVILFSRILGLDGLDETALNCVEVIGTASDEVSAIDGVSEHFNGNPALKNEFKDRSSTLAPDNTYIRERDARNQLWFLRGAGTKGDEIHAGIGQNTLYRIVETA